MRDAGPDISGTIDQLDNIPISTVSSDKEPALPWYADQILPFDVTLAGTNEMGAATAMRIWGIEILNVGNGTSIDDTVNESQATFVARFVDPHFIPLRVLPAAAIARAGCNAGTLGLFVLPETNSPRAGASLKLDGRLPSQQGSSDLFVLPETNSSHAGANLKLDRHPAITVKFRPLHGRKQTHLAAGVRLTPAETPKESSPEPPGAQYRHGQK